MSYEVPHNNHNNLQKASDSINHFLNNFPPSSSILHTFFLNSIHQSPFSSPMADPRHSPPRPPRPKPPTPTAGKSPNKRKTTAAAASSPANKHPNRAPLSTADIEDTATSKGKKVLQEVDLDDIEVYERILEYRNKKGVFPFESPAAMKNFLLPWIILCIGNEAGWKMKLEHVKNKFTKDSAPIQDEERKEFDLWKKIWGNEVEGGDEYDPTGGS